MMKRFLEYHIYGTGIQYKGTTIPLATGTYVHLPVEHIAKFCQEVQQNSPEMVPIDILALLDEKKIVRKSIENAITKYVEEVDNTSLRDLTEYPEDVDNQVTEQCSLVGGLVWVWVKKCLPWVLENYDIIAVEREFEYVIDCTCGLSDIGEVDDHEARGCSGVVLMTRPDLILRHRMTGQLIYVELKTGADVKNYNYAMQYEDNVQFALGAVAASKVLGEDISELYVHALHKGRRDREYNQETRAYDGLKRQNSPFCYAFYKEAQPPMVPDDLRPQYWNKDLLTGGKWGATEKKGYKKLPTWEIPFIDRPSDVPHYEHVVNKLEALDGDELANHLKFIGPISNPAFLIDKLLVEMAAEERRWAERLEYLDTVLTNVGGNMADEEYQTALAQVIPRSWDCYKYAGWCEYQHVSYQKEGWEDPIQIDKFVQRSPNHPIEANNGKWEGTEDVS
jgi:hypothetical protein